MSEATITYDPLPQWLAAAPDGPRPTPDTHDKRVTEALSRLHSELGQWRRVQQDAADLDKYFTVSDTAYRAVLAELERHCGRVAAAIAALETAVRP